MWKRGWKVTTVWMAAYTFLCQSLFSRQVRCSSGVLWLTAMPSRLLPEVDSSGSQHPPRRDSSQNISNPDSRWRPGFQEFRTTPSPSSGVRGNCGLASQPASHPEPHGLYVRLCRFSRIAAASEYVHSSDVDDAILPFLPHLTYQSPYTPLLLTTSIVTLFLSIPLVYLVPLRFAVLVLGLLPFFFTHPFTRSTLLPAANTAAVSPFWKTAFSWFYKVLDDDRLEDKHWRAELRQVEVFENERWSPHSREASGSTASVIGGLGGSGFIGSPPLSAHDNTSAGGGKHGRSGWGKSNLKSGERKAWTRGRDGWSGIAEGGDVRSVFSRVFDGLFCTAPDSHGSASSQQLLDF